VNWKAEGPGNEGRSSFLKKRSKRLLIFQVFVPPGRSATALAKSLGSFLQKRTLSAFTLAADSLNQLYTQVV
jgi:hypothetical protein